MFDDIEVIGTLYEAAPVAQSSKTSLSKKPASTKAQREKKLKSAFKPVFDIAAQTVGATDRVVDNLGKLLEGLNVFKLPVKSQQDGAAASAASASLELVANPKVQKNQKQTRTQPSNSGAPMTKQNKKAQRQSQPARKATKKQRENAASGRNSAGKRSW